MRVFLNTDVIPFEKKSIATVGTFDGVHAGHREILKQVVKKAEQINGRSVAVTFEPHPRIVVSEEKTLPMLSTIEEKKILFESLGIDVLVIIEFTKEFSQRKPESFIKEYLIKRVGLKEIVIGYDHRFGKGRDGDEQLLKSLGDENDFAVTEVKAVEIDEVTVSSSKIRSLICSGEIAKANLLLERPYSFSGKVIKGDGRGSTLGFPTANLQLLNRHKAVPDSGVYPVTADFYGSRYEGVMNIGLRPTFGASENRTIEVHLFDFDISIYGEELTVTMYDKIRGERKFSSKNELIAQIEKDSIKAKQFFSDLFN